MQGAQDLEAEHNLSVSTYPFLKFPQPQPAKTFPFYLQTPEQSCKCQLGQQMAVTAVDVWDRGSRWGTEKQVSPPSWTSPGTGPHLYSGQPWSWKLVRGEETPSTSLLLLTSQMCCCGQSLLRCHFVRAEHHAEKRGWRSREVARLLLSLQASICISVLENLTCPDQECPQALFVGTPQGADSLARCHRGSASPQSS